MKQNRSIRNILISYVKNNGPMSWTELHNVVLTVAGQPFGYNGYGSCYLDRYSYGTSAFLPTDTDPGYLVKSHVDGLYHYVEE